MKVKSKTLKWQLWLCMTEKKEIQDTSADILYGKADVPFARCWGTGTGRLGPSDLWGCCRWAWGGTNPCESTLSCRKSRTPRSPGFLGFHPYLPPSKHPQESAFRFQCSPSHTHVSVHSGLLLNVFNQGGWRPGPTQHLLLNKQTLLFYSDLLSDHRS